MSEVVVSPSGRAKAKHLGRTMVVVLVVLLIACCAFLFWQYRRAVTVNGNSDASRIAAITKQVNTSVMLPDEEPTIAKVTDTRKLAEPQLAKQAQNGDEILVYAKAQSVILYRPSVHKIVDMFRVQQDTSAQTTVKGEKTTH